MSLRDLARELGVSEFATDDEVVEALTRCSPEQFQTLNAAINGAADDDEIAPTNADEAEASIAKACAALGCSRENFEAVRAAFTGNPIEQVRQQEAADARIRR